LDNYDPFDNDNREGSLRSVCIALLFARLFPEGGSKLLMLAVGFSPNRFSNARLNSTALEKPTSSATLATVFLGLDRRRLASFTRKFSTNPAGVLPSTLLNARLK
jgi:hypothetical protein